MDDNMLILYFFKEFHNFFKITLSIKNYKKNTIQN